jgi:hypothetical protein
VGFSRSSMFFSLVLLLLTGCGPKSLEDFREEGEGLTRSLIEELQSIHARDDLVDAAPRLQKLFNELVDVMIASREFKEKHPHLDALPLSKKDHELSDQLRGELNRILHLEGGREVIEKCQEQALERLDAFEKRVNKLKS